MKFKRILLIGSTSGMAEAFARLCAERGCELVLIARNADKLAIQKQDLEVRGARQVETYALDFDDLSEQKSRLSEIFSQATIDVVLIAHGVMYDQEKMEQDPTRLLDNYQVNFLSPITLCNLMIPHLEKQGSGQLAVISSVAGDRGRKSNYLYGSAKAGLQAYLSGLRGRLLPFGVNVLDIRPGFVATPMTAHLPQGPLFAKPAKIAKGIMRALEKKKMVTYQPWFWFWIMLIIRMIPNSIFKKLSI